MPSATPSRLTSRLRKQSDMHGACSARTSCEGAGRRQALDGHAQRVAHRGAGRACFEELLARQRRPQQYARRKHVDRWSTDSGFWICSGGMKATENAPQHHRIWSAIWRARASLGCVQSPHFDKNVQASCGRSAV